MAQEGYKTAAQIIPAHKIGDQLGLHGKQLAAPRA